MADASAIEKLKPNELSRIKHVVAIMSGKGGVGKSSVAALLATEARRQGHSVGVLDADVTGPSIPRMFGMRRRPDSTEMGLIADPTKTGIRVMSLNLLLEHEDDPVIWRGPLMASAVKQFWTDVIWGDIDYLVVDLPPGTGDSPLTVMQSLPLEGVVIVTSPQSLAGMVVRKAVKMARLLNVKVVGLIENMAYVQCPACNEEIYLFGPAHGEAFAAELGVPFLGSLPIDPAFSLACDTGTIERYNGSVSIDFSLVSGHIEGAARQR